MASPLLFLFASLLLVVPGVYSSTLYGYYFTNSSGGALVSIDPQTGGTQSVCDLSTLPRLNSAASSSVTSSGMLLFYTIQHKNISVIELDPTTCAFSSTDITGLAKGQEDVRDIKYDSVNNILYMVFPNPFCMHGSLDAIDLSTGAVISSLADVIDPPGFSQTTGLDGETGYYYYIGIPLGAEDAIEFQINKVSLKNGNATTVNLPSNALDLGNTWQSNYTLNVVSSSSGGAVLIGAVSPANDTVAECYPSGFYSVDPSNGQVTCAAGPVNYMVYTLAELDQSTGYFYQLFTDASDNYYMVTYDTQNQDILYTVPCKMCSMLSSLAALP